MDYVTLNSGVKMPMLGFGVCQVFKEDCETAVPDTGKSVFFDFAAPDTADRFVNFVSVRRDQK